MADQTQPKIPMAADTAYPGEVEWECFADE